MFDNDISPVAVQRRLREEMARRGISSDAQAAEKWGKHPQQWVSRHMSMKTDWKMQELQDFCAALQLDYRYVTIGIRTIDPPPNGGNVIPLAANPEGSRAAAQNGRLVPSRSKAA